MSESDYRKFIEDGKKYQIGESTYEIKADIKGSKLVEWRKLIFSEDTTDIMERMKRGEQVSRDILESALIGFSYDKALDDFHPTELEGAAGDVFTFLYLKRPEREMKLLSERLKGIESVQK